MNSFMTVVYESIDDLNQEPIGEPLGVSEGGGGGGEGYGKNGTLSFIFESKP